MSLKQNKMKFLNLFRIRLKQNRYPVLLLTQGINSKYDDYSDPRTWTIENGSSYVAMAEILGMYDYEIIFNHNVVHHMNSS